VTFYRRIDFRLSDGARGLACPGGLVDFADKHTLPVPALLCVHPLPAGEQHVLKAGKYELMLEVVAGNGDAARYTVAVEWDGVWPGKKEKMWQSLRVQPPQKV
jgi:hypothetical protein